MKSFLQALSLFCVFSVPVLAHADTLYTINNGLLTNYQTTTLVGTYGGTFTLSTNFTILSGNLNATVNGITFNLLNMIQDNDPQSGHAQFLDSSGDVFNLHLTGTKTTPLLCDLTTCPDPDSAFQVVTFSVAGKAYSANGGTLSGGGSTAVTPEPSSLILLGTGLLGVVAAARRRLTPSA